MNKKNDKIIIKSNNLIDCSYKLTLAEQRLLNIACKRLKPLFLDKNVTINEFKKMADTMAFEPIEISVSDYRNEYRINSKNIYTELSKIATTLYEKEIIYFDGNDNLTRKRWVITCKYKEKEGKIALKFHPDLVADLLVFKGNYTQLNVNFLNSAKSFYSLRLYELLRQYLLIKKRAFDIEEFRFKMGLSDVEYPRYANLKQRVLKPSIEWINENSDIHIKELKECKTGRTVSKITFVIENKNINAIEKTEQIYFEIDEDMSYYKKIKKIVGIDLTGGQIEKICDSAIIGLKDNNINDIKGLDYIQSKWEVVKKYGSDKEGFNYVGALIVALKNNWSDNSIEIQDSPKLKFNNFEGRDYDWAALEEMVLGNIDYDATKLYNKNS